MYKYIVYHITIYKDNEYYRYEQKKSRQHPQKILSGNCHSSSTILIAFCILKFFSASCKAEVASYPLLAIEP